MSTRKTPTYPTRRRLLTASVAGVGLLSTGTGFTKRAIAKPTKIGYGQGSIDPIFTVGYVALAQNYFEKEGLRVNYLDSQSGPRTNQLLAAKQILIGATAAIEAPKLTLAGKPACLIFGFDKRMTYANVLVRKKDFDSGKITTLEDLAGERIGATQPGSVTALMADYLVETAGIADTVEIRPLGDLATMLGALKTGSITATMATASMMSEAINEGWAVPIFDGIQEEKWNALIGGDVPGIAAYTLQETIDKQPETIQGFVNAMVKAQHFINQHGAKEITDIIYQPYLSSLSEQSVHDAVQAYQQSVWLANNIINEDAYNRMLEIMGGDRLLSDEALQAAPYSRCVDMSFVKRAWDTMA